MPKKFHEPRTDTELTQKAGSGGLTGSSIRDRGVESLEFIELFGAGDRFRTDDLVLGNRRKPVFARITW